LPSRTSMMKNRLDFLRPAVCHCCYREHQQRMKSNDISFLSFPNLCQTDTVS